MLSNVVFDALLHGQSIQSVEIERSKTKSFLKFLTVVSKFGKNKDNLCLHKCLKESTDLFVIGFSRLRTFLVST